MGKLGHNLETRDPISRSGRAIGRTVKPLARARVRVPDDATRSSVPRLRRPRPR